MASRQRLRLIRTRDGDRESHKRPRTGNLGGRAISVGRRCTRSAERMTEKYALLIRATRRHSVRRIREGISVPSHKLWEPVRERSRLSRRWSEIQPVEDAAAKISEAVRAERRN
jgi:hypothetical protein